MNVIKLIFKDTFQLETAVEIFNINGLYNVEIFSLDDFLQDTQGLPEELIDMEKVSKDGKYYLKYFCDSKKEKDDANRIIMDQITYESIETGEISVEQLNDYLELKHDITIKDQLLITSDCDHDGKGFTHKIYIVPGMGFGTGEHETTFDSLRTMFDLKGEFDSFFDVGCGSGILSILASKLGAKKIEGIDIDQDSINNAFENCKLNKADCDLYVGDVFKLKSVYKYDLVVANIYADILTKAWNKITDICSKYLIVSGIVDYKWESVKNVFEKEFDLKKKHQNNEWVTGLFVRKEK
ncbi:50S ribosomal protein L11 methyltransferase [bacterium]|nr:50S ribosomal protein L11 methyltransferase [bacterium]